MAGKDSFFYDFTLVSHLGLTIVVSIVIAVFVGMFLDKHLHTRPLWTVVFLVFGVVGGFTGAYKSIITDHKSAEQDQRP